MSRVTSSNGRPRKLFLERRRLPLPEDFTIEQHLTSRTWKHAPETLLIGSERVLFYSTVGTIDPHLQQGSLIPQAHVRDGVGNEIFVWQDSAKATEFFLGGPPSGEGTDELVVFPEGGSDSGKEAFFIDAIPEKEGMSIFWAERGRRGSDWEMMAAFWYPLYEPASANDFTASLSGALSRRQSLALLGQEIEQSRVGIVQDDWGNYSAAWIAHEGKRAFVKSLRFQREQSRWREMKQRYLSGKGFVRDALGGFEKLMPISGGAGALLVGRDSVRVISGSALEPESRAEVIIEAAPDSIQSKEVPGGIAVVWFDGYMRLALVSIDERGASAKGLKDSPLARVEILSENRHFAEHGIPEEAEVLLLGMTVVWLDRQTDDSTSLWAIDWGGDQPECLVRGLPEETRLLPGEGEHFYLAGERSCFVCSVKNRGISGNLSSTIGEDVLEA